MPQAVQLNITCIQHVGIPATNIKVSEAFYQKLGFKNVMQAPFNFEDAEGTAIMMQLGNIIIELYQFPEGETLQQIQQRGAGHIDHIAFDVKDVDATFNTLKNAGYDVIEEAPVFLQFWKNGCKYFNVTGPSGERLEFNQVL